MKARALVLLPLLLLAACAPSAAPAPTVPIPIKTPALRYFAAQAWQNGREVAVKLTGESWLIETDGYTLLFSLTPELAMLTPSEKARYDAWRKDGRSQGQSANFLAQLLSEQPRRVSFRLQNRTASPVRILWSESRVTLMNRRDSQVLHQGVPYGEMGNSLIPTLVAANARLEDYLLPIANLQYDPGTGWREKPLFDTFFRKGQTMTARLSFELRGQRTDLDLRFTAQSDFSVLP